MASTTRSRVAGSGSTGVARRVVRVAVVVGSLAGLGPGTVAARQVARQTVPVSVDGEGVMRWTATNEEVALFGVNYTAPFAYAYRAVGRVGADRKRAIDADVSHLARLGVDAFRVHVWDREVSDREGDLVPNDHLDLLDYLIARLGEHGVRTILTPIAWWGTGYPELDAGWTLRVRARSAGRPADRLQVALVERDGTTWGAAIDLTDGWRDVTVPLSTLRRVPLALLPRPYPEFLPYLLTADTDRASPDPSRLDGIQLLSSPELFVGGSAGTHGFEVESVLLARAPGGP